MRAPFDDAVIEHGPTVLRVCRAVVGPGADADDAWSETFLSALRAWPDLPEGTDVRGWLVRVAHRRAVDVVRRAARAPDPAGGPDEVGSRGPVRSGRDDDEAAVARDEADALWAHVAALPVRQRLCVAYRYLGGLRHAEVAEIVGGTEAAARRSCADGVAALRRALAVEAEATDGDPRGRHTDPAHTGSAHTGSAHTDPAHTGSAHTDPAHTDPARRTQR